MSNVTKRKRIDFDKSRSQLLESQAIRLICLLQVNKRNYMKSNSIVPFHRSLSSEDSFFLAYPSRKMQCMCLQESRLDFLYNEPNPIDKIQEGKKKKQNKKQTKDICCPNKSACCNVRGYPGTTENSGRIIHYGVDTSQLLEQEKCCAYTYNCSKMRT